MPLNRFIPVGLSVGLTLFAANAFAQTAETYGHHPYMWGHGGGWGYGGHFLFPILGIIVVVLVIMGVARMMGCTGYRCGHRHGGSAALAVLEERYAKGEIDKAEFEERKATLSGKP